MDVTYWVDADAGNDANDGLSYANSVQTMTRVHQLINGLSNTSRTVTINLVETPTYHAAYSAGTYIDINKSAIDFVIQGTDSSGNSAWANVGPFNASNTSLVDIDACNSFTFQYLNVDLNNVVFAYTDDCILGSFIDSTSIKDITFQYCIFKEGDATTGSIAGNARAIPFTNLSADFANTVIRYCYFENAEVPFGNISTFFGTNPNFSFNNNVFVYWAEEPEGGTANLWVDSTSKAGSTIDFFQNTFIRRSNNDSSSIARQMIEGVIQLSRSDQALDFNMYCNLWYFEYYDGTGSSVNSVFSGATSGTGEVVGEIHSNRYYANCINNGTAYPAQIYNRAVPLWDTGLDALATDLYPFEEYTTEADPVALFADPDPTTATYDWTPTGSDLAIPLAGDWRPEALEFDGPTGTLPIGALPSAIPAEISYTVAASASATSVAVGDSVSISFEVTNNSLVADADIELDVVLPPELSLTLSTPTAGTYAAGTWTVTISANTSETIEFSMSVSPSAAGLDLEATGTVNALNSVPTPDVIPTEDSVTISVAAETDFTVQALATIATLYPGETTTLRAAISNDAGGFESDAVVDIVLPSFVTVGSATPSSGTYDAGTGQWTLAIATGAAETLLLYVTVSPTATPQSDDFEVTVNAASDPPPGGNLSDDTDSVTVTVLAPDPVDPESPVAAPFLDVLPLNTTELLLDLNMAMQTKQNRLRKDYLRADLEEYRWRECSLRRIEIGTNTTTQLNLGGIQRGQFAFIESSTQVDVSIGNDTNLYAPAKVVVLSDGKFSSLYIRNNSTTVSATVLYGVTD